MRHKNINKLSKSIQLTNLRPKNLTQASWVQINFLTTILYHLQILLSRPGLLSILFISMNGILLVTYHRVQ